MRSGGEDAHAGKRSLLLSPPTYAPSLVFPHDKKYKKQLFYTLGDENYYIRSVPQMREMNCIASCFGWLILRHIYSTLSYLFDPSSSTKIQLPPLLRTSVFYTGLLTSPPTHPTTDSVVLLFDAKNKSFLRCQVGDDEWIEKPLEPKKELSKIKLHSILPFCCKENIYLFLDTTMMVVLDSHGIAFPTKILHKLLEFPVPRTVTIFDVESCGDIFRVMQSYLSYSLITQTFNVFKFDFSTMDWAKVDSLGDRIFLLCDRTGIGIGTGTSFSSTELAGVKGNCIYFASKDYTHLNKFDMENGTITTTRPCPENLSYWDAPFWIVPNSNYYQAPKLEVVKHEVPKLVEVEDEHNKRNWSDLMPEILEQVLSYLFLHDCTRFQLTCKAWMRITPPIGKYPKLPRLLSVQNNKSGRSQFYNPIDTDSYIIDIPELAGAVVHHAKDGWFLMRQGNFSMSFFNPLSLEIINIPLESDWDYDFVNLSFSSPPTCSDCVVIGHKLYYPHYYVRIYVYRMSESAWGDLCIMGDFEFFPSFCSPVFCGGVFYSLARDGKLGVFDPRESMWKVLPKAIVPEASISSITELLRSQVRSFLMEYGGDIFSVFVGEWSKFVSIFMLDQTEMKWIRVENLGDKVMFVSHTASMLVPAELEGIQNRIYFPRFHGKDSIYYSLSTGKYHTFGGKTCGTDWINTSETLNSTWYQPSLPNPPATLQTQVVEDQQPLLL